MELFNNLTPDYRFKKITDITPEFFRGAELIILDLDNTLVFLDTTKTKQEIVDWLTVIKKQYHCVIFSNSFSFFKRAPEISKLFDCELFLSKSKKPFKNLFWQMQKKYHVDNDKIFVVGDRLFTDVLFGKRNGVKTILIDPLNSKENIIIALVRKLENLILKNKTYDE